MATNNFQRRVAFGIKLGLTRAQSSALAHLDRPEKIQDFVSAIPINNEKDGDTCLSVVEVLRQNHAHCIESAFVAACALWMAGMPPLLMDFQAKGDDDHVIAIFKHRGCWGAISKSNHIWLRWRDPVYRSLRELAVSYFNEYVTGPFRTMLTYSAPFDLRRIDPKRWVTSRENCWDMALAVDGARHYPIITPAQAKRLVPRDRMEINAGTLIEFDKSGRRNV